MNTMAAMNLKAMGMLAVESFFRVVEFCSYQDDAHGLKRTSIFLSLVAIYFQLYEHVLKCMPLVYMHGALCADRPATVAPFKSVYIR